MLVIVRESLPKYPECYRNYSDFAQLIRRAPCVSQGWDANSFLVAVLRWWTSKWRVWKNGRIVKLVYHPVICWRSLFIHQEILEWSILIGWLFSIGDCYNHHTCYNLSSDRNIDWLFSIGDYTYGYTSGKDLAKRCKENLYEEICW